MPPAACLCLQTATCPMFLRQSSANPWFAPWLPTGRMCWFLDLQLAQCAHQVDRAPRRIGLEAGFRSLKCLVKPSSGLVALRQLPGKRPRSGFNIGSRVRTGRTPEIGRSNRLTSLIHSQWSLSIPRPVDEIWDALGSVSVMAPQSKKASEFIEASSSSLQRE